MSGYDPAAAMLEEFMRSQEARTSAHLHCGNGRVALASLAGGATELWCSDRRLTSVIATRELIAARGVDAAHVVHAQGAIGFPDDARVEAVTIRIPTERMGMQQLVHDAFNLLVNNGVCVLAGGNNEGVKPAVRTLESVFGNSSIEMNHSGHRLVVARKTTLDVVERNTLETRWLDPDEFNTLHVAARGRDVTLFTRPGVFSWEHLDEATSILADEMDIRAGESVLDIGCGAGLLGILSAMMGAARVLMVDSDAEAVRCVAKSIELHSLQNAEVRASDVTSAVDSERFDVVLSNPPFHHGKAVDLATPRRFIRESWEHLVPGGRVYIVANRTLPYERVIEEQFGNIRVLHDGRRFKVLGATR